MTFDEIKQAYIEGAPLDETLERLAEIGESPDVYYGRVGSKQDDGWVVWIGNYYGARPTIREAMMAAFDAE